jgi:uncharacterized protein YdhG (YjbR/CyaY superfamily)
VDHASICQKILGEEQMRIYDERGKKEIDSVLLRLTKEEAKELADKVSSINPEKADHIHVNDLDFKREITVLIYNSENPAHFSEEVQKIING